MRSKYVNRYADELYEKARGQFTEDFAKNKQLIRQMDPGMAKMMLNELAGRVTHLVKAHGGGKTAPQANA